MKVLYFARARELAGTKTEDTDEFDGLTVAEVLAALSLRFGPEFGTLMARSTIMVDDAIVTSDRYDQHPIGAELAILPPVSGGDGPTEDRHHHSDLNGTRGGDRRCPSLTTRHHLLHSTVPLEFVNGCCVVFDAPSGNAGRSISHARPFSISRWYAG